jgi:lipopolysaccharide biosynthesis glycosyltransferase
MRYYVTLFDSNYLTRGLTMYRSLLRHELDFHLWIICFDNLAYEILSKLKLDKVTLVSLTEFEDPELLKIKPQRTQQEYCWTCTPSTLLYVLNTIPEVDRITYLDADLMFFSPPEAIFAEAGGSSIILTEHRYLPEHNQSVTSGIYNVQFMMFRRDKEGLKALNWWCERCLEWCYARFEDNKFGDQKYLDDWLERFENICVVKNLGAGLAPWNAAQYQLTKAEDKILVEHDPLIFYHFHALKLHHLEIAYFCAEYPIGNNLKNWVYIPYLQELQQAYEEIRQIIPQFNNGVVSFPKPPKRPKAFYHFIRSTLKDIQERRYYRYARSLSQ